MQAGKRISTNVYGRSPFSKGFRKAAASPRCSALCQKITQTSAQCQICNQRNDQKTDQHQCSLYKVSYAYSHKSPHKCIAENDCCTNCQSYMIINSKYCVKKFTACCQCRSCRRWRYRKTRKSSTMQTPQPSGRDASWKWKHRLRTPGCNHDR